MKQHTQNVQKQIWYRLRRSFLETYNAFYIHLKSKCLPPPKPISSILCLLPLNHFLCIQQKARFCVIRFLRTSIWPFAHPLLSDFRSWCWVLPEASTSSVANYLLDFWNYCPSLVWMCCLQAGFKLSVKWEDCSIPSVEVAFPCVPMTPANSCLLCITDSTVGLVISWSTYITKGRKIL